MISFSRPGIRPERYQLVDVNRQVRHLRMYTVHSNKRISYIIDGLIEKYPKQCCFVDKRDGQEVTIKDYFQKTYQLKLEDFPLVRTSGRQPRYIPLELCFMEENQFLSNQKITLSMQREMLRQSTHSPNMYFSKLDSIVKKAATVDLDLQEQFGVRLDPRPVSFESRVLNTPRQLCSNQRDKFYSTYELPKRWGVFCFDSKVTNEQLSDFVLQMMEQASFYNLNFGPPNPVAKVKICNITNIYNAFHNLHQKTQAEFVFVGIPTGEF